MSLSNTVNLWSELSTLGGVRLQEVCNARLGLPPQLPQPRRVRLEIMDGIILTSAVLILVKRELLILVKRGLILVKRELRTKNGQLQGAHAHLEWLLHAFFFFFIALTLRVEW